MNLWLFAVIQAIASVIITFALIVIMLVLDWASGINFIWCFVVGTVVSLPVAWLVYKRIDGTKT